MTVTATLANVERLCADPPDSRQLRLRVLEQLRRHLDVDSHAWLLTDPETWVGSSPLADVPWLADLPTHIRLKYGAGHHRWTQLAPDAVASGPPAPSPADPASEQWWAFLQARGIGDVASVVFADSYGCWGFLELFRAADRGPFTSADRAVLQAFAPVVTRGLRTSQRRCFPEQTTDARAALRGGPAALVLTPDLVVLGQTAQSTSYLAALVPAGPEQAVVPAAAYNVAAQLLARESGTDPHPPTARIHLGEGVWLALRAARLDGPEPAGERGIAVTIEHCSAQERLGMYVRVHGLSDRETAVVTCVAAGQGTREIALQLHLSPHTVQDHLKSVFEKTGVRSRAALLARCFGT